MTTQSTQSAQNTQTTAAPGADAVTDPAVLSARFIEACNAADLDRLLALYEPDAIVVERTGEPLAGTAAIRGHLARLLALRPAMELAGAHTVVHGDLALGSSHWRCEATAPDGSAIRMEAHSSELSRRQADGTWLMIVDNPWGTRFPES